MLLFVFCCSIFSGLWRLLMEFEPSDIFQLIVQQLLDCLNLLFFCIQQCWECILAAIVLYFLYRLRFYLLNAFIITLIIIDLVFNAKLLLNPYETLEFVESYTGIFGQWLYSPNMLVLVCFISCFWLCILCGIIKKTLKKI